MKGEKWDTKRRGYSLRPYRIWDCRKKCNVRWKCYLAYPSAIRGVLAELHWNGRIGQAYEVYDIRNMRVVATYKRTFSGIAFQKANGKGL